MRYLLCWIAALYCSTVTLRAQVAEDRMLSYTTNPAKVSMHWKDEQGRQIRSLDALRTMAVRRHKTLVFAMNGGMYQEDRSPLGLFIDRYLQQAPLNQRSGNGNFYLQPNGVFCITARNKARITPTRNYTGKDSVKYATQSGPMLLVKGRINKNFKEGSVNLNIRNGVGVLPGNRLLFVLSREPVNFYDFAMYFKQKGCTDALYLDGFVSRAYLPAQQWMQIDGDFGVMIAVME